MNEREIMQAALIAYIEKNNFQNKTIVRGRDKLPFLLADSLEKLKNFTPLTPEENETTLICVKIWAQAILFSAETQLLKVQKADKRQ